MTRPITVLIIAVIVGTVLVMAAPTSTRAYWQLPVEHVCSMSAQDGQFTWKVFMNSWSENLSFTWEVLDDPEFSGETGGPIEVTPANNQYNPVYFTTPASGAQRVRVSWSYEMGGTQIDASWTAESYRCLIVEAVTNPVSPEGVVHIDVYIDEPAGPDYISNSLMGFTPGDTRVLHGYGPGFSPGVEIASYALNWAFVGYVILDDPRDACPAVPAYGEDPSPYADNGALAVALGDDLATFTRKVCVATHAMPLQDDGGGGGEPGGPEFTLSKEGSASPGPDGRIGFRLIVTNAGSTAGIVEVQDALPSGFDWRVEQVPSRLLALDCGLDELLLLCEPEALQPGQSAVVNVVAPMPEGFCGQVQNTAQYRSGVDAADGPWQDSNTVVIDIECGGPPRDDDQRRFFDVVVRKVVLDSEGLRTPGEGWEFVIEGCGGQLDGVTGDDGTIRWSGIPVPQDCEYRVSEVARRGWVVLEPGPVRVISTAEPGAEVALVFVNTLAGDGSGDPPVDEPPVEEPPIDGPPVDDPPGAGDPGPETTPVAGPTETPSPATPGPTPDEPSSGPGADGGATPTPSATTPPGGSGTPPANRADDIAGERATGTPPATGTPKPPATGNGTGQLSRVQWGVPLTASAVGLLVLAATVVLAGVALRR